MARQHRLHAVEDTHEEHVALAGDLRAGLHHEANHTGCTFAQGAAGLVGHIAHGRSSLHHTLPSLLTDVGLAVERAGNRADGHIECLCQTPDTSHIFRLSPKCGPSHSKTFTKTY